MLNRTTIRISLVVMAAGFASGVGSATAAHAHSSCTPAHLVSTLREVESECGKARIVSDHRPGARIRGTRHASQHSFCNGTNGAIDAVFANRACALSALRQTTYTILTYGRSSHIHIGTDGWRSGGTRLARHHQGRVRTAARSPRTGARVATGRVARAQAPVVRARRQAAGVHTQAAHASPQQAMWPSFGDASATSASSGQTTAQAEPGRRSGRRFTRSQRAYARAPQGRRGHARVAHRHRSRAQ